MAGQHRNIDYAKLTKRSVLLGVSLLVLGFVGHTAVSLSIVHAPGWVDTVLVDAEYIGVLVMLFSPFIFGIFLPLTE